ncbi:SIP domain-containing protein [Streptomyces sp. NPDC058625]|uniref:SIP domain-containing protein n=1 Tax=Streptomyces sp. NPDC058625 TaxID=3346564 RepID=UPI00364D7B8C
MHGRRGRHRRGRHRLHAARRRPGGAGDRRRRRDRLVRTGRKRRRRAVQDSPMALDGLRDGGLRAPGTRLPPAERPYVWFPGESGRVKQLRRSFVGECGPDRTHVTSAGYWRRGPTEERLREQR